MPTAIPVSQTVNAALTAWASSPDREAVARCARNLIACLRSQAFAVDELDRIPERDQNLVANIFLEWMTTGLSEESRVDLIDVLSMLQK